MINLIHQKTFFDAEKKGLPKTTVIINAEFEESAEITPQYNVVLLDDNDHTYDYVIEMLMELFGHSKATAFEMACEVDFIGRVVVYTSGKDEAEVKRDEIISYGPDWRLERSKGSMSAVVEPVE